MFSEKAFENVGLLHSIVSVLTSDFSCTSFYVRFVIFTIVHILQSSFGLHSVCADNINVSWPFAVRVAHGRDVCTLFTDGPLIDLVEPFSVLHTLCTRYCCTVYACFGTRSRRRTTYNNNNNTKYYVGKRCFGPRSRPNTWAIIISRGRTETRPLRTPPPVYTTRWCALEKGTFYPPNPLIRRYMRARTFIQTDVFRR